MPYPFNPDILKPLHILKQGSWPESWHRFDPDSVCAINAAIASGRPLLLRGEPGIGKSQLARAAAAHMKVPFLPFVVDERTERDDLFLSFDAVARLAQAQISAIVAQGLVANRTGVGDDWFAALSEQNYFRPGVLWWAFSWETAITQSERFTKYCRACKEPDKPEEWQPASDRLCGPVVLIDEIDKADPSVPNGLLECLGNQGFETSQLGEPIQLPDDAKPPLIILTTNEDRELPAAFLRRCLVLQMRFPSEASAETFLLEERARVFHEPNVISDKVCKEVAALLLAERSQAIRDGAAIPGAAEYLDILRVLVKLHKGEDEQQSNALKRMSKFALKKSRDP